MLWCTCQGLKNIKEGYVADPVDNPLWVHGPCRKPSRMVFEKVTYNRAPRGATALLSYRGDKSGIHQLRFAVGDEVKIILTYQPYDRRPYTMGVNPNDILLNTWKRLDLYTEMLMDVTGIAELEKNVAKAKARAYAEVLADMMPPFFDNPDDIVREAVIRYKNRENPDYETPGLGQKSLAEFDKMPYQNSTPTRKKAEPELDEATRAGIKKALESGMFTVSQLAKSYSVSHLVIESCR